MREHRNHPLLQRRPPHPEALPGIIEALLKDGYTLVPASELILPGTYNTDYTIDHVGRQMPCSNAAEG